MTRRTLKTGLLVGVTVLLILSSNNFGAVRNAAAAPKFSEWSAPVNLGPAINSAFLEQGPAISKDGLSLFLTSGAGRGGFGAQDLWVSQRASQDDPWGLPMNLGPTVNSASIDSVPALSRDEHWLFFNSDRPGGFGLNDLWASYREHVHDDFDWQAPVNLGPSVNSAFQEQGAGYFENDPNPPLLYFNSNRPGGPGALDIYVSAQLLDGSWGPAEVVPELSSPANDQRPIVRFDGLEVFLWSNRPGGFGDADVWVSTRDAVSDPWGPPVNLGPTVNSPQLDAQGYLSSDRLTLYFASNRPGGLGGLDLYETTRTRV